MTLVNFEAMFAVRAMHLWADAVYAGFITGSTGYVLQLMRRGVL